MNPTLKVEYAILQTAVSLQGTNLMGATHLNQSKYPGIKLSLIPSGLLIEFGGKVAVVPSTNVSIATLTPETAAKLTSKAA